MTREEAIKNVKMFFEGMGISLSNVTKESFNTLIPELRESEDERIRKWLYDYISNCPNNNFSFYGGVGKDAVLNYLEKQKEQKPRENHTLEFEKAKTKYEGIVEGKQTVLDNSEDYGLCKPAEWSEEDENNLNKLLQWDGIPLGLRSWVSGLPKKVGTRPSWKPSEEQMKALDKAIPVCAGVAGKDEISPLISLYEQLKKLWL